MSPPLEPLGILSGPGARMAIEAGVARPLNGGPLAFTVVRALGAEPVPVASWPGSLESLTCAPPAWAGLPPRPLVMGILNLTPDSFSEPGRADDPARAIEQGRRMWDEGAAIINVGGESTRPGASPVAPEEEQRRILPVIAALARAGIRVSVDTRNAATMERALDAGAAIINDVSALTHDPAAAPLLAARNCPVILMHMRGEPRTMNALARYDDLGGEVLAELEARVARAEAAGIERARIAVDPGFGFAKIGRQNGELLCRLPLFVNLQCRIIAGMSRKRFLGELAGVEAPGQRGPASVAAGLAALSHGATILRVHDVAPMVQAVRVWQGLFG